MHLHHVCVFVTHHPGYLHLCCIGMPCHKRGKKGKKERKQVERKVKEIIIIKGTHLRHVCAPP